VTPDALVDLLGHPQPASTEALLRASGANRFGDLQSIARIVELVDGLEPYAEALNGLCEDLSGARPEKDARLRSPLLRGWLNAFGRVEDWSAADPLLLDQLGQIDNMRFGFLDPADWEGVFAVCEGVCSCWDARLAVAGFDTGRIELRKHGSRLTYETAQGATGVIDLDDAEDPRVLRAPRLVDSDIVVRNDLPPLRLRLREGMTPTRGQAIERGRLDTDPELYASFDPEPFLEAARLVRGVWPEEYDDWCKTLRVAVPRKAPRGWTVHGMTVASHQGACWIVARGFPDLLDALVHEQSHVKLRYIEESLPILEPEQPEQTFQVGWRSDPRPLIGIYEGVYVNLHVIEALGRCVERGALDEASVALCRQRIRELQRKVSEALNLLTAHGRFTELGRGFLEWAAGAVQAPRCC